MNGEAHAGRLNGVRPFELAPSSSVEDASTESVGSFLSPSAAGSSEDISAFSAFGWRKEMDLGLTETMSPGARRVFAFWCYWYVSFKDSEDDHDQRTFFPLSNT
jgi:hypothetical protein